MQWVFWALVGIGGLVVIWQIYVWILPEPVDLPPKSITDIDPDGDPDLGRWYAPLVGASVQQGNRVKHLRNGDEIFPAMLQAIEAAADSVHFLTYVYWTGKVARQFADALEAAGRRGCEVRVVLDAVGAFKMDQAIVQRLEAAGCTVARFHPLDWYSLRRINHRTHRKILVLDGRVGFTGGVGIAEEWEGDARNAGEWRDDHFQITGPAVQRLQGAFAENWLNSTGEFLAGDQYYPEVQPTGDARIVSVATARREDVAPVLLLYWLALRTAQKSVEITTPYFVPDSELVTAFEDARRRGVEVRLLLPSDHNDSRVVRWTSQALYPELLEAGVEIFEFSPTMIHSKVMTVDHRWSIVGSANYDNRSFELNHEFVMLVDDCDLNSRLKESFECDLERSEPIRPSGFQGVSRYKTWLARIGLTFREQM